MGGLNGFEFGPDDKLYGPLWFKGQVAKVDVDKAELTVVADGFKIPAAVNFDSKGNLFVVDTALGQLVRVDPKSGAKKMVAQLKPSLDNLAIDDKDRIFVSNMIAASSLGGTRTALIFVNRPRFVALFSGLMQMWARLGKTEEARSQIRER